MDVSISQWIENLIIEFVNRDPENDLRLESNEKAWAEPLVGFASATDELFSFLKNDIGDFYWLPIEAYKNAYPSDEISEEDLSIISWVLPQAIDVKADQRDEVSFPSERWSRSRLFGEQFNDKLRDFVVKKLQEAGFYALAPMRLPAWKREDSSKYGFASSWSERHTAFICGLGTFGLSDGLITAVGKAARFGSVIVKTKLEPTPRPYKSHNSYCLFHYNGKCQKCAERCPADAISSGGHDKVKCHAYIRKTTTPVIIQQYGLDTKACGLCQAGVPCESKIPLKEKNWR